jgi:hypothetical protein
MTTNQITSRHSARRPLKSPLAVPGGPSRSAATAPGTIDVPATREALSDRAVTRAEFEDYLRTTNNRYGRLGLAYLLHARRRGTLSGGIRSY